MKNPLKKMLKEGKVALGTAITTPHPDIAEALATVGFDWILIDTEHSPIDVEKVQNLLQAMSFSKTIPIVRVAWNDMVLIKRILDTGPYGIIVPWVNTKEEAEYAVKAIRYPPEGIRGYGPRRPNLHDKEYAQTANSELFLGVQIETKKALDNLEEILSVEGIDSCVIGPYDFTMSLGIFGQVKSEKFNKILERIVKVAEDKGVTPGILAVNQDEIELRIKQGFRLIDIGIDLQLLLWKANEVLEIARNALEK